MAIVAIANPAGSDFQCLNLIARWRESLPADSPPEVWAVAKVLGDVYAQAGYNFRDVIGIATENAKGEDV